MRKAINRGKYKKRKSRVGKMMSQFHFYCTSKLAAALREKFGSERGRCGKLSANIERLLWKSLKNDEVR